MGGLRRVQMGGLGVWVGWEMSVGMGGWVGCMGAEMVSSIVMYNFGGGPRFAFVSASSRHAK